MQIAHLDEFNEEFASPSVEAINIIILDDNSFDRQRLRRLIDEIGIPVELEDAESISALKDKLDDRPVDLVLIDYHLPEGDGLEALGLIKSHACNGSVATIMVTGDHDSKIAVSALKAGCDDYVEKDNLDPESLRHAVFSALHKSSLNQGDVMDADIHKATYDVLKGISEACFDEMRPALTRILRHTRKSRSLDLSSSIVQSQNLEEIESSCMTLLGFLREIDSYKDSWKPVLH